MRVIIDINGILEKSGGMGNYLRMLVTELAAIDRDNEYVLYLHQWRVPDRAALERLLPKQANFRLVWHRVPNSVSLYADYRLGFRLTELLLKGGPGTVFHGPSNIVPRFKTIKSVVSLHHYVPMGHPLFPRNPDARNRFYFGVVEESVRGADRVVAISENTRKDLVEKLGLPPERISVVYVGGPNPAYRKLDGCVLPPGLAAKLPGKYILFPGPLNERKNLPLLLKAFAAVREKLSGYSIALTTNPSPAFARAAESLAASLGIGGRLAFLGEVSDEEMAVLYNRAQCMVYPSLFEGFGNPPLEAMACGCPVAASNATAIPEVVGGAALLFDPNDASAASAALLRIVEDEALRRDLVAKGFARVKFFSWRRMAEEMLAVYEEAAGAAS